MPPTSITTHTGSVVVPATHDAPGYVMVRMSFEELEWAITAFRTQVYYEDCASDFRLLSDVDDLGDIVDDLEAAPE